jgi:hypothetical protein
MSRDLRWGFGFLAYSLALATFVLNADPSAAAFALPVAGVGSASGAFLIFRAMEHRTQEVRDERSRRRGRRH